MKPLKFAIIGLALVGVLVGICGIVLLRYLDGDMMRSPPVTDYFVEFPEIDSKIYMRSRVWGLTSDHEETRLQTSPIDNSVACEPDNCLIIYDSEIYYKKDGADTLDVFATSSSVPKEHTNRLGRIKLALTEVGDDEELRRKAEARGLSKVAWSGYER